MNRWMRRALWRSWGCEDMLYPGYRDGLVAIEILASGVARVTERGTVPSASGLRAIIEREIGSAEREACAFILSAIDVEIAHIEAAQTPREILHSLWALGCHIRQFEGMYGRVRDLEWQLVGLDIMGAIVVEIVR